jgi:glucokinase
MLEDRFGIPVFIHNDGDLFAYGEALGGFLPQVNRRLKEAGSPKRFKNLLGVTFGTGFGGGIVRDGEPLLGDNSMAAEIWLSRDKKSPERNAEESVSIRGVRRFYSERAGVPLELVPEPKEIFDIGMGCAQGDRDAAREAFRRMGEAAGEAMANALTLVDGLAVIGGGLSGAWPLFLPALMEELNGSYSAPGGSRFRRLTPEAFNLEDPSQLQEFLRPSVRKLAVPGSGRSVAYEPRPRIGVGLSRLGTSQAVALGAYVSALRRRT